MNEISKTLFIAAVSALVVFLVLRSESGPLAVFVNVFVSVIVGLAFGICSRLFRSRIILRRALRLARSESDVLTRIRNTWIYRRTERFIDAQESEWSSDWMEMSADSVRLLTKICFENCRGRYIGTDRNVPSRFFEIYPEYLGSQISRPVRSGDVRFVLYDWRTFQENLAAEPDDCRRFVSIHVDDGMTLLRVDWKKARKEARRQNLPSTDFGLFGGEFVVFFDPPSDSDGILRIKVRLLDQDLGIQLETFLVQLASWAKAMGLSDGEPAQIARDGEAVSADRKKVQRAAWSRIVG